MKKGRPKNIKMAKNRAHSIILTEKAELILREILKKRGGFNLNEYLSSHIVIDFENGSDAYALYLLLEAQKKQAAAEEEVFKRAEDLTRIRNKRKEEEVKIRMQEAKEIIGVR